MEGKENYSPREVHDIALNVYHLRTQYDLFCEAEGNGKSSGELARRISSMQNDFDKIPENVKMLGRDDSKGNDNYPMWLYQISELLEEKVK